MPGLLVLVLLVSVSSKQYCINEVAGLLYIESSSIGFSVWCTIDMNWTGLLFILFYWFQSSVYTTDTKRLVSSISCTNCFSFRCTIDMKCLVSYIQWYHETTNGSVRLLRVRLVLAPCYNTVLPIYFLNINGAPFESLKLCLIFRLRERMETHMSTK